MLGTNELRSESHLSGGRCLSLFAGLMLLACGATAGEARHPGLPETDVIETATEPVPVTENELGDCLEDSDCVLVDYRHCCGTSKRAINRDLIEAYESHPDWHVFDDPATCAVIGVCRDDSRVTNARCAITAHADTGRCELVWP